MDSEDGIVNGDQISWARSTPLRTLTHIESKLIVPVGMLSRNAFDTVDVHDGASVRRSDSVRL